MQQAELDARQRALLFKQLAQAERAGLTALDAARLLIGSADARFRDRLAAFRRALNSGKSVADAGLRNGLFLPWEARLVQAAEVSGKLAQCYAALATRHSDQSRRSRQLKNGILLPLAIFVLAVFIAPLSALVTGAITGTRYLFLTIGRLLLFFGALFLLSWSWRRLSASGADNSLFRLLLRIPFFGRLIRRQQQRDYLFSLALLLEAGVPAFDALSIADDSVSHPTLRKQFGTAETLARSGQSITDALVGCGAVPDEYAIGLAQSGEYSGRLSDSLHHLVRQLEEQLELQFSILSEWSPRVAYVLVIVVFLLGA